jgi:hypothetical protein
LITLNFLSDNNNFFSMMENNVYDAWKGDENSSTNITSNPFITCSNHSFYNITTNECEACNHENLGESCQICGGVDSSGTSICLACDNTQGPIYQLSNNTCYLRNDTCKFYNKDSAGNDTSILVNYDIAAPSESVCKPCEDLNKFIDLVDPSNPKCSLQNPFTISLDKGDNNFTIDVNMLDFNKEYEFQVNDDVKAGFEQYKTATKSYNFHIVRIEEINDLNEVNKTYNAFEIESMSKTILPSTIETTNKVITLSNLASSHR